MSDEVVSLSSNYPWDPKLSASDQQLFGLDQTDPDKDSDMGQEQVPIPKKSALIKTDRPRPHICATCTRAFARLEHLKRHERSHTNEKPFQCAACGRCFARRDLVLRHQQKLHSSLPTNNRTKVARKGRGTKSASPREGEVVSDYLNDNINIVRNNTHAKLPLPGKSSSSPIEDEFGGSEQSSAVNPQEQYTHSMAPAYTTPHSISSSSAAYSPQKQPRTTKQKSTPTRGVAPSKDPVKSEKGGFRDQRHASFSAATANSYTGFDNEIPTQVQFSSPQFNYENGEVLYLDLDSLDLQGLNEQSSSHNQSTSSSVPLVVQNKLQSQAFDFTPESSIFSNNSVTSPDKRDSKGPTAENHNVNEDWLFEFMNAPIEKEFPTVSNHIGFTDSPGTNNSNHSPLSDDSPTNDLSQFFRSRQLDLFKKIPISQSQKHSTIPGRCSEFVRNHIMTKYNLKVSQFPQLDDLNHYLALYEIEFNRYFPFVHIPTLNVEKNLEQIPLLLSMAAIGALYSFHARNSSTLFNFSRFLIHNFLESQLAKNKFNEVPLHITQALLLHMFLGMFHNDVEVTKLTSRQLTSLVSLVKTTKLDMPIETFQLPPAINSEISGNDALVKSCYEYFVLAQSRIRTVHCLHYLCVLFGSLIGSQIELTPEDIRCGLPCHIEKLWTCRSETEWISIIHENKIIIDSKFSLIQLGNGTKSYTDLWHDLNNHTLDTDIGLRCLLSLLMSLNGDIHNQRQILSNSDRSLGANIAEWRLEIRPHLESIIKSWETCFIRNGGPIVPQGQNLHTISQSAVLKLILPLLSFAKIRKCVYISPILQRVWHRDWDGMNSEIKHLTNDPEALRDSISYSLDIINLWIEIMSINNDAEKTSVRTPIFFLTCLFTAALLISEYLFTTEEWAINYLSSPEKFNHLTTADRVLWLRTETIFKKVERNLLPKGSNNSSYSEFLRIQANGALDVDILDDEIARLALEPGDLRPIAQIMISARLSSRCLSLGVRILADAPVWPIALVFAEALKARATAIHHTQSRFSPAASRDT
ncbi:hypothetical protein OGAPHI_005726 [Ogataea philodendri]|uniref:C2H2-type domain-containing protein n=1 Tax=Ogataea philodendri TaxID=1378263 RepID=A0A9P8P0K0_9ASCO|nr:uncharacterized protein OGAPHI_005726 [Ogataea philodendri]KAH3662474.1 hypothetical protein OGAPHI_005726 [Ogataea philodendri]